MESDTKGMNESEEISAEAQTSKTSEDNEEEQIEASKCHSFTSSLFEGADKSREMTSTCKSECADDTFGGSTYCWDEEPEESTTTADTPPERSKENSEVEMSEAETKAASDKKEAVKPKDASKAAENEDVKEKPATEKKSGEEKAAEENSAQEKPGEEKPAEEKAAVEKVVATKLERDVSTAEAVGGNQSNQREPEPEDASSQHSDLSTSTKEFPLSARAREAMSCGVGTSDSILPQQSKATESKEELSQDCRTQDSNIELRVEPTSRQADSASESDSSATSSTFSSESSVEFQDDEDISEFQMPVAAPIGTLSCIYECTEEYSPAPSRAHSKHRRVWSHERPACSSVHKMTASTDPLEADEIEEEQDEKLVWELEPEIDKLEEVFATRLGFAMRLSHMQSAMTYLALAPTMLRCQLQEQISCGHNYEAAQALFSHLIVNFPGIANGIHVGQQLTFFMKEAMDVLCNQLNKVHEDSALRLQKAWRGFTGRKRVARLRRWCSIRHLPHLQSKYEYFRCWDAVLTMQAYRQGKQQRVLYRNILQATLRLQRWFRRRLFAKLHKSEVVPTESLARNLLTSQPGHAKRFHRARSTEEDTNFWTYNMDEFGDEDYYRRRPVRSTDPIGATIPIGGKHCIADSHCEGASSDQQRMVPVEEIEQLPAWSTGRKVYPKILSM